MDQRITASPKTDIGFAQPEDANHFLLLGAPKPTLVIIFALLATIGGAGGMAISFAFLASSDALDVLAGTAGFIAGAVLLAAALVSIALVGRRPVDGDRAVHALACLYLFGPPLTAIVAWPVIYSTLFLGGIVLLPAILIACVAWAGVVSVSVTAHLGALRRGRGPMGGASRLLLCVFFFILQLIGILASAFLFSTMLEFLESQGYKVGWS